MSLILDPRFTLCNVNGVSVLCAASEVALPAFPAVIGGSGACGGDGADAAAKSKRQLKKEAKGIVKEKKEKPVPYVIPCCVVL